jgi:hypothetical protein
LKSSQNSEQLEDEPLTKGLGMPDSERPSESSTLALPSIPVGPTKDYESSGERIKWEQMNRRQKRAVIKASGGFAGRVGRILKRWPV